MVIDYPHLYSFTGFFYQSLCYAGAYVVVGEDIILQVDIFACIFNVGKKCVKFCVSVGKYLYFVAGIID